MWNKALFYIYVLWFVDVCDMFVARVQRKVLICCTFLPWCLNFVWLWMKALSTTIQMIINNTTVQACGCNSNVWPFKWTLEERRIKLTEINRSFSVTWSAAFQLIGIKEIFNLWKEFNSHRIFFCTQTWPPINCFVHKYGRRDVMWKRCITTTDRKLYCSA